jgi:hypothetical protein
MRLANRFAFHVPAAACTFLLWPWMSHPQAVQRWSELVYGMHSGGIKCRSLGKCGLGLPEIFDLILPCPQCLLQRVIKHCTGFNTVLVRAVCRDSELKVHLSLGLPEFIFPAIQI